MEAVTLALFALAQALDAMSTHYAITQLGAQELMPAAAWAISQGWDFFLVCKLVAALAFMPVLAFLRWAYKPSWQRPLHALAVIFAFVPVIGNIAQIVWFSVGG